MKGLECLNGSPPNNNNKNKERDEARLRMPPSVLQRVQPPQSQLRSACMARARTHTDTHTHKHTQHTHTHTRARAHAHTHRPPRVLPRPHARGLQRSPMTRVASSPNTGASVTKKAAPPTESPRELPKIEASLERRALLVGTGKLSARNVTAVARALENRAFRTCVQLDLSQARLHEAIRKWRDGLPPTCVACVMFSGLHVTLKPKP
jgi:hypothetical protein